MNDLETYKKIQTYFENRFDSINELYYKKIITEMIEQNPEWKEFIKNTYGDNQAKFNELHIEILKKQKDIEIFYKILEKYKYNFLHTTLWCIYDICNTSYEATEKHLIERYLNSPNIYSIEKYGDKFLLDCILGKFQFEKASTYLEKINQKNLAQIAKNGDLSEYCHDGTLTVAKQLKNSSACTMLCNQAFVGQYYHSVTIYDNNCIDLNYNCIMPFEQYQKLMQAEIIQIVNHNDINEYIKPFSHLDGELLYGALNKQADDENIRQQIKL